MLKNSMPQRDRETAATSPNTTLTGFVENVVTDLLPNQQCQHCLMTTDYRKTVVSGQCATKNVPMCEICTRLFLMWHSSFGYTHWVLWSRPVCESNKNTLQWFSPSLAQLLLSTWGTNPSMSAPSIIAWASLICFRRWALRRSLSTYITSHNHSFSLLSLNNTGRFKW